ncbi:hypothetical protein BDN72DRAFT_433791 [Pluteus cervinus]|uniref:Uncharacterized protein n=1 Tax=Pluteus cervinus TaxID=181527 RepID=A0ACD3AZY6_9AGAR|nr:hypothetical protein BDN72DRAFT_433791 [Pluteus cervinus]
MVKFSHGMWWDKDGVAIDWATEVVNSKVDADSLRCVVSTKHIKDRGDTLNRPTITVEASSPSPDVLLLKAYHWKAQKSSGSVDYELYPDVDYEKLATERQDHLVVNKTNEGLTLSTDTITLALDTRPKAFAIDVFSHGSQNPTALHSETNQLLTKLGLESIGYVRKNTNTTPTHPIAALSDPDQGERWITMQFHLSVGEKIYGLGERFGPFVKNGQSIEMWNEDSGTNSEMTYKNVPFYLSSRGYGIFIPCAGRVSFEVQSERTTRVNIAVPYEAMSAYIIHGPHPCSIIERYTLLTGRPALPPPWTFGLWLSTSFTTSYDEKTVNSFLDGMEARNIPVEVFHFDCFWQKGFHWCDYEFDQEYFPDAKGQLRRLKEKGYKVCVWINPYIAQESKIFDEGVQGGYFLKKGDGCVWQTDAWQAGMAFIDFTNPEACKWYQSKLIKLLDLGVDCFKTDFGERIPIGNVVYHNSGNMDSTQMHNFYPFLYNKTTFEVVQQYRGRNEAIVFARSATAGCQRFPVHWGGDPLSSIEAMAETLRGGLSLGLCGFGFWAHDIGGFEGTPDAGLYKRWFAFGCLSSHSRLHGSGSYRVPWLIDPSGEADIILSRFIHLKHALMPYLYSTAIQTHRTGVPMMRPVFLEFPGKEEGSAVWNDTDTEYMLGSQLLVMPVMDVNERGWVQGYVPSGRWWRLLRGNSTAKRVVRGPSFITECHGYGSLPVLLRPGGVIVLGPRWDLDLDEPRPEEGSNSKLSVVYDWAESPTILVNPFEDGRMNVCVDIPSWANPEQSAARIHVTGSQAHVKIELVDGQLSGGWKVHKVRAGDEGECDVVTAKEGQTSLWI